MVLDTSGFLGGSHFGGATRHTTDQQDGMFEKLVNKERGLGRPDGGPIWRRGPDTMAKRGGNGLRAVLNGKSPLWKWSAPSEVDNGNGLRP